MDVEIAHIQITDTLYRGRDIVTKMFLCDRDGSSLAPFSSAPDINDPMFTISQTLTHCRTQTVLLLSKQFDCIYLDIMKLKRMNPLYFSRLKLDLSCSLLNKRYDVCVHKQKQQFVDVATGSLGQGLGAACGMAYTGKYFDKARYSTQKYTHTHKLSFEAKRPWCRQRASQHTQNIHAVAAWFHLHL